MPLPLIIWVVPFIILVVIILPQMIRILREYERGVIFRLGKLLGAKGPGLIFLIPIVDRMVRMDLRVVTISVEKQEVMTRDNVPVTVDAVVYFRVVDPQTAVVKVVNFLQATSLIAQTTLRSVLGQAPLDDLLSQRETINQKLQEIIDRQTEPWGVKVTAVEVKDVALPDTMKRAMAKQAEAERERRAKIVNAEGEFQAAEKMVQAAAMMSKEPIALQLRFLQTMREISSEHNTTTFLPVPIDLFTPFINKGDHPRRKLLRHSGRCPQRQCGNDISVATKVLSTSETSLIQITAESSDFLLTRLSTVPSLRNAKSCFAESLVVS
jgi:regulator of protease activity HflC (stomatin/prohibitin superfamily)